MTLLSRFLSFTVAGASLMITGCATSQPQMQTDDGAPLARQISQSSHCGLTAPGHLLLKSAADVGRLEGLQGRTLPLAPLRAVDFDREHVVLASLGQKPTGGYSATLVSAAIRDDVLELSVRIREPQPGMMVSQALTTPCAAIAVAATGWSDIRITPEQNNR
ncbi:protease complex subunit PrcB family protein [Marinobacter pelagius]|uniref:protease complex subunit PrcB family protein n=1 Tax=Marinobacter sp. C7 TaxID=2951363 RepID=UPI001EF099B3|nr:protease complex subunit PrcB family protein [Marinobacter sp. C7]MCG7198992.1 protease complex subunit PrcB family protein [Marinobacter sp. C7]